MNNSIGNSVNFKAKLDISGITKNKARWGKIAKEFELKTKQYPEDTFEVIDNLGDDYVYFGRTTNCKTLGSGEFSMMKRSLFDKLQKLEDKELVGKLKRLFNLQMKFDNLYDDARNFLNKYVFKSNIPEEEADKFAEVWVNAEKKLVERHLKNDKFLYANRESIEIY